MLRTIIILLFFRFKRLIVLIVGTQKRFVNTNERIVIAGGFVLQNYLQKKVIKNNFHDALHGS